jgi:hypothetical protein
MSGTAASAGGGAGFTLSNILVDSINSYARDPNDTLNAALYSYGQSRSTLEATFRRHTMDPRGRIAVALPGAFEKSVGPLGLDEDEIEQKMWHATTREELAVLIDSLPKNDDKGLYLVLWEGADFKPPTAFGLSRAYKKNASGAFEAMKDIRANFSKGRVAAVLPVVGPAYSEEQDQDWVDGVAKKVCLLIGKMKV